MLWKNRRVWYTLFITVEVDEDSKLKSKSWIRNNGKPIDPKNEIRKNNNLRKSK